MRVLFFILLFIPIVLAFAAGNAETSPELSLGQVAKNLMEPVGLIADFVQSACFIIGGSFIFASFVKYIEHRKSPLMVPISTVVFLLMGGALLVLLPFLSLLLDNGMRYSLWG